MGPLEEFADLLNLGLGDGPRLEVPGRGNAVVIPVGVGEFRLTIVRLNKPQVVVTNRELANKSADALKALEAAKTAGGDDGND